MHMTKSLRPSSFVFAHCNQSKTGCGNGLGTRLLNSPIMIMQTKTNGENSNVLSVTEERHTTVRDTMLIPGGIHYRMGSLYLYLLLV